ncbi:glycine--tRNA ligase subunit beta [Erythrobacter sp. LQ02-29]|uniref:glycine--tRNA ligase subunit beta n=1 Tax=Erythrobacter sp. LQ02-29 TaxID=2920384 RepID=UPI001F4EA3B4|nr:glycine--tRNA ligase subunit beta [Erythrobacter sp. LQ02-29]
MSDFLLELRSEEIPARMQAGARAELEKLFRREMDATGVGIGQVTVWSTPRRLALIARNLPEVTQATREELKGPPVGAPDQAIDGFCRKNNIRRDDLEVHDVKGRATYFWIRETEGKRTIDILSVAIRWIIEEFSWPKSMRWGAASISTESMRWVRPLSGIVALLGDEVVECEVHGVTSGAVTLGHRFHHAGDITIGDAGDYAMKLRAGHVIVDHEERAALIRKGAAQVASEAGLSLVEDEGLVVENAGLTEWPVPLLGRFEEDFLDVPPEVIQLTARVNQKYFVCETPLPPAGGAGGGSGEDQAAPTPNPSREREGNTLANAFVCTANIEAADGGAAIVDGNRKVLAARLSDARFFWEQDRKTPLAEHAKRLERITFHEKLGTVADKVDRVAKLARWLVEEGIVGSNATRGAASTSARPEPVEGPHSTSGEAPEEKDGASTSSARAGGEVYDTAQLADWAEQAARLAKADLVTEMVGEFPELQGLMGGYYARAEGLPDAVADAIRDHYKPVGQGDEVPTAPVTVAVSLADKLDTLAGFFAIDEKPTGSKDPFALRRAGLAILALFNRNQLRADWRGLSEAAFHEVRISQAKAHDTSDRPIHRKDFVDIFEFLIDRLKVQQREAGVRHDLIDAVFALGNEDDLVRLLNRVKALQNFVATPDGQNLLAAYKRAANILKKEGWDPDRDGSDRIARTGEEDPLALVDDPDMAAVVDARMAEKKKISVSYAPEPAERALIEALDTAEPRAVAAVEEERFEDAMGALATLRAPIDAFFEEVTVNAEEEDKRAARLGLLARFRDAVDRVADFSRIEG